MRENRTNNDYSINKKQFYNIKDVVRYATSIMNSSKSIETLEIIDCDCKRLYVERKPSSLCSNILTIDHIMKEEKL